MSLIGALDQGTSSTKLYFFNLKTGEVEAEYQVKLDRSSINSGWVEQDANLIYESVITCMQECANQLFNEGDRQLSDIAGLGIANQRETTIAWDNITGEPLHSAIVWSDNRTQDLVDKYICQAPGQKITAFMYKTGLPLNSYFSAFKIRWLLDNVDAVNEAMEKDRLCIGTVDSFIIWKLTQGKRFVTDPTNASRTLLMNLNTCQWDDKMLEFFDIPKKILPRIVLTAQEIGPITDDDTMLRCVFIGSLIGDQQAALIGHTWKCNDPLGECDDKLKVTYGTGAFLLWNIGKKPLISTKGLVTTVAYKIHEDRTYYAIEGAVSSAGSGVDWLRDKLGMAKDEESYEMGAANAYNRLKDLCRTDCDEVYFVPAFTGLLCPYWREDARSLIIGMEENCDREDFLLAGLRACAYQTQEMISIATELKKERPVLLVVDGGLSQSDVLLQSLADIIGIEVVASEMEKMTALGAAIMACVGLKLDPSALCRARDEAVLKNKFATITEEDRCKLILRWKGAVTRSLNWRPYKELMPCECLDYVQVDCPSSMFWTKCLIYGIGGAIIGGIVAKKIA